MAQQFLLSGSSLEELTREATALYGADARIVRAERVLDPGLAGFLGRRHLEVTVEVPGSGDGGTWSAAVPAMHVIGGRAGIAALLASADTIEDDVNLPERRAAAPGAATGAAPGPVPQPTPQPVQPVPQPVSTESGDFAQLLARLGDDTRPARVPLPLSEPGDIVLVLGLEETALAVTAAMAQHCATAGAGGWSLYSAGVVELPDRPHVNGWWDAIQARALAVEEGTTILAAAALGSAPAGLPHLGAAAALGADQVWLVVDARHKPDETAEWVGRVRESLEVDALAVVGVDETRSPDTVNQLRIPLGWLDGRPAPRTVL